MTDDRRREGDLAEPHVETVVTAGGGKFTYRVLAFRKLEREECKKVVWRALQVDHIAEPEPGGEVVLVTRIGRRDGDETI